MSRPAVAVEAGRGGSLLPPVSARRRGASGVGDLVFRGALHPYRHDRYGPATSLPAGQVDVLTPAPVAAVLRAGYRPELHPSASGVRPTSRPS